MARDAGMSGGPFDAARNCAMKLKQRLNHLLFPNLADWERRRKIKTMGLVLAVAVLLASFVGAAIFLAAYKH
jgi:hypothetical protein